VAGRTSEEERQKSRHQEENFSGLWLAVVVLHEFGPDLWLEGFVV
jgi:hypothetical protein